jgi:hypothetical protein
VLEEHSGPNLAATASDGARDVSGGGTTLHRRGLRARTWLVEATTSGGHDERRGDIVLSTSVTYDVIEIQTAGTRG